MVRIAICDDVPHELRCLVALAEQYVSTHGIDAEVTGFSHPDALLTAMEAERFHLYVLDIVISGPTTYLIQSVTSSPAPRLRCISRCSLSAL